MTDSSLLELGVGLTAALLVIREVLKFLAKRREPSDYEKEKIDTMQKQVQDLYDWHNVTDEECPPHERRSLRQRIERRAR